MELGGRFSRRFQVRYVVCSALTALEKGNIALSNPLDPRPLIAVPGFTNLPFTASFDLLCHLVLYAQPPLLSCKLEM